MVNFYRIKGLLRKNGKIFEIDVQRRFSDFEFLNKNILRDFSYEILPVLPEKIFSLMFT